MIISSQIQTRLLFSKLQSSCSASLGWLAAPG